MVMEMVKTGSRFQKIFEEAKQHPAYWMEDLRLQFLNDIYEIMQEQKLAQKDLAEKMGVSEAYISKVFNGNVEKNFTLKTLIELGRAVNAEVHITVTPKESEEPEHSEGTN
jgi:transcriptional regulator with XRE-family HTH domain